MPQRSPLKVQGVSTQRGASRGPTPRLRGAAQPHLYPPKGARLWAWLALAAVLAPGAWSFLNEEQEELLVELHNHYRGLVSPSASAMLPLKWDPFLQIVAQNYAAKCEWGHNLELGDTGENLFVTQGPLDLREALEKWFLERLDYDYHNNSCDEDKMCGHYTQMVWADTHRVGCAFHLCNVISKLDWERASFLVCNYYPPGNYESERPYVEGDWCSRCPEELQKCENNLCVGDEEEEAVFPPPTEDEEEKLLPPGSTAPPAVQPGTTTSTHAWSPTTPPPTTPPPATPPPATPPPATPPDAGEPEKNTEKDERMKDRGKKRDATEETVRKETKVNIYNTTPVSSAFGWLRPHPLVCVTAFFILHV